MGQKTTYRAVRLTKRDKDGFLDRTKTGKGVLKIMRQCFAEGGAVTADTTYDKDGCEWLNATLEWPDHE